jgi:aspartyl-tRNA(Asn)/glutamyl-tRNA(Gln) amidotransferase subunit B
VILNSTWIQSIKDALPELPQAKMHRFEQAYGLSPYDAQVLTSSRELAHYFEQTVQSAGTENAKLSANWIMGELLGALNKANDTLDQSPIQPTDMGMLIKRISDNTISGKMAKIVFEKMWQGEGSPDAIIAKEGLIQITDLTAIQALVDQVIAANPDNVAKYQQGKTQLLGFFVGQVMKLSQGTANPEQVNTLLQAKLQ